MADGGSIHINVEIDDAAAKAKLAGLQALARATAGDIGKNSADFEVRTAKAESAIAVTERSAVRSLKKIKRSADQLDLESNFVDAKDAVLDYERQLKIAQARLKQLNRENAKWVKDDNNAGGRRTKALSQLKDQLDAQDTLVGYLQDEVTIRKGIVADQEKQLGLTVKQNKLREDQLSLLEKEEAVTDKVRAAQLKHSLDTAAAIRKEAEARDKAWRNLGQQQLAAEKMDRELNAKRLRYIKEESDEVAKANRADVVTRIQAERMMTEEFIKRGKQNLDAIEQQQKDIADARRKSFEDPVTISKLRQEYVRLQTAIRNVNNERIPLDKTHAAARTETLRGLQAQLDLTAHSLKEFNQQPPPDVNRHMMGIGGPTFRRAGDAWAGFLGTTVRLGPFTSTVQKAAGAISILSSALLDVGGAGVAFVGVLGTGIAGAAAVATPGLIGMGIAFGGVFAAMKPVYGQFKLARQATTAYNTAVAKYGAESKQAAKAQEVMNRTFKGLPPSLKDAANNLSQVSKTWKELTAKPASNALGDVLKSSTGALKSLTPTLASITRGTLSKLSVGISNFMDKLKSPASMRAIEGIGRGFNAFLGPALSGVSRLTQAVLKFAASGARHLGDLGRWFNSWAGGLDNAASRTSSLNATVDRLVDHAKSMFRVFGSLGKLLGTVLNGGADAGKNMADTMADAFDRWRAFLKGDVGKAKMKNFFNQAVSGAQALWKVVAALATGFASWGQIFSPVMEGVAEGIGLALGLLGKFLSAVNELGGMKAPGFIAGLLVTMRGLSKFANFLRGGGGAAATLGGGVAAGGVRASATISGGMIAAGNTVAARISAAMLGGGRIPPGGIAPGGRVPVGRGGPVPVGGPVARTTTRPLPRGIGPGGGTTIIPVGAPGQIAKTASSVSKLSRAAAVGRTALLGLGSAVGLTGPGMIALGVAAGGYGVYKLLTMKSATEKLTASLKDSQKNTKSLKESIGGVAGAVNDVATATSIHTFSVNQNVAANDRLQKLVDKGYDQAAKGSDKYAQYRQALDDVAASTDNRTNSEKQLTDATNIKHQADKNYHKELDKGTKLRESLADAYKNEQNILDEAGDRGEEFLSPGGKERLENARKLIEQLGEQMDHNAKVAQRYKDVQAGAFLALKRELAGLPPLTEAAMASLGRLARFKAPKFNGKKISEEIATNPRYADPRDAEKVGKSALAAGKAGVSGKVVMKIVADATSADQAVRRLRSVRLTTKYLDIVERGGKEALDAIRKIAGGKKNYEKVLRILASSSTAEQKINNLKAMGIPDKIARAIVRDRAALLTIAKLNGISLKDLQQIVNRFLGRDESKQTPASVTQTVFRKVANLFKADGTAAGKVSGTALVGEGASGKGAKEYIANQKSGQVSIVTKPTYTFLGKDDFVIPTEARYRNRGRQYAKQFMASQGMSQSPFPEFAAGKKPALKGPAASEKFKASARSGARAVLKKRRKATPKNRLKTSFSSKLAQRQQQEDDLREIVQREDAQLSDKEPTTFLKKKGTDPFTGEDIFEVDTKARDDWTSKLTALAGRYQQVVQAVLNTQTAATNAATDLKKRIAVFEKNKTTILGLMSAAKTGISEAKTKKGLAAAKQRYATYKDALGEEKGKLRDGNSDLKEVNDELHEIGDLTRGRYADAVDAKNKVSGDAGLVSASADKELASATNTPSFVDPLQGAQDKQSKDTALSQIQEIIDSKKPLDANQRSIFDIASGYLGDNDPANDSAAVSAISSIYGDLGLGSNSGSNEADSAVAAQQKAALDLATGNATRNAQALATFAGYGDIGGGGFNAYNAGMGGYNPSGMGGTVVNINTLHPGDPQVALAVANATSTGYGYQGGINTSRGQVG